MGVTGGCPCGAVRYVILVLVRAGSLDDPEIARPSATIWVSKAPSWACIDEGLPKIEGQAAPVA